MFYILEIQQYQDLSYGHIVHWAETKNQAESKFYTVLAAAAVSELPTHSVAMIDTDGNLRLCGSYHHEQPEPEPVETTPEPVSEEPEAEPEPEPEPEIDNADEQEPVDETPVEYDDPFEGVD